MNMHCSRFTIMYDNYNSNTRPLYQYDLNQTTLHITQPYIKYTMGKVTSDIGNVRNCLLLSYKGQKTFIIQMLTISYSESTHPITP